MSGRRAKRERWRRPRQRATALACCALVWIPATGCTRPADARTPLPVFAASSLTESLEAIEADFEDAHPTYDLRLSFAGSQVLRLQIEEGADAAVFASANEAHLRALERAGLVAPLRTFASNDLVVIVPADADQVQAFSDLPRARRIVIGDETVPVGQYTQELLQKAAVSLGPEFVADVRANIASHESNVRLVRAKVALGEADAAIVYRGDAYHRPELRIIELPANLRVRAHYFVAPLSAHADEAGTRLFVDYLLSPAGQAQFEAHGFAREGT